MHRIGFFPAAIAASFLMLAVAFAEDSADLFLKAYEHFQTAEKLEREGKPREALVKYEDASKVLEEIRKQSPDWQPLIVEYRLKKVQDGITRLQPEVANLPPPVESIEGPMPEADRESPRRSQPSSGPQVVVPRSTPNQRSSRDREGRSSSAADRELRELREQLEEAKRENRRLASRLEKQTGTLQMALAEVDRYKVSLVEQKAEVAQLSAALEDARKDGTAGAALRAEFDKRAADVVKKLTQTEADNEVLQEENARLLAKLEDAAKYITTSDGIRESLLKDREKLETERDAAVNKAKKVKDNTAEIEKIAAENKALKTKLTEAEKLAAAKASDAEKLLRETKILTNKLAEAILNSAPPAEVQKLTAQRDALQKKVAELEKIKVADPAKDRQLANLQKELEAAQKRVADLEKKAQEAPAPDPAKDRQIAALQSDLNTASDRLLEAQSQVSQSEDRLRNLQKQLDQATGELAQLKINPTPSKEEKNLIAENELLRNIILRQIKEQTRRDEAVKAVEAVVASVPDKLDAAKPHLAVLGEPALKLTDEERALFSDPVSLLTQPAGAESLDVTMVVAKPGGDQKKTRKQAANAPLPPEVRKKFEEAKKLFEAEDFAGAEKVFQNIVEIAPDNYYILSNLGAVQIESGKLSAAEVALKKAIQINSADSYAHRNLGIVYSRQGKIDSAINALRRSVAADDKDSIAHNYLGVCLGQKEERQEAEMEFKRAISINPNYPAAHFNLAVLYATSQPPSLAAAKEHYKKAIELGAPPDASLERLIQ
jgi:Flp pilus assembly protein TadD/chromosome segregation ATPase